MEILTSTSNQTSLTKCQIKRTQSSKSERHDFPCRKTSVSELRKPLENLQFNQSIDEIDAHVFKERELKKSKTNDENESPHYTKKQTSKDNRSIVTEEVIIPLEYVPVRSTMGSQNFYMRNYPNGNDQRYLSVENNNLQMTNTTTVTKCKFVEKKYPNHPNMAVTFQHAASSKYISATTTQGVTLVTDTTPPQIFQSSDSKFFFKRWHSGLDHYYFESVTNQGYYLAYDRINDDVKLLQLSASSLQNQSGNAIDAYFRYVPLN